MTYKRNMIACSVVFVIAVGLLVSISLQRSERTKPLNASESVFVGTWNHVSMPEGIDFGLMSFESDRTFRTQDGEFNGRWWISAGELNLKMWRDEPTNVPLVDVLILPISDAWNAARADIETWQLTIDENGDRIELSTSQYPAETLVRSR